MTKLNINWQYYKIKENIMQQWGESNKERDAHGIGWVEGDKHATQELNVSVGNYMGLQGLFVGNELCIIYAHSKTDFGFIRFHI